MVMLLATRGAGQKDKLDCRVELHTWILLQYGREILAASKVLTANEAHLSMYY